MTENNTVSAEEIKEISAIPVLLVFGKSRSGTTLLQSVLNTHPNIVGPQESKFMMVLYPRYSKIKNWTEREILGFVEELFQFPLFSQRWNIDKKILTEYLQAAKFCLNYSLACRIIYYLKRREKKNILLLSDKNPDYYLFINHLFNLFPEARFIHLVREPKDNVLSTFKTFGGKNTYFVAAKWVAVNAILEKLKKKMPGRSITVQYEKMVENPEMIFKSICNFLNIPFVPDMLKRETPEPIKDNNAVLDTLQKRQTKLFSPVSTSSIGKWKKDMDPFDAFIIDKITGKFASENYGYATHQSTEHDFKVPYFKIFAGKSIYFIWQSFTRFRYQNYSINKFYSMYKRKKLGDKILPWQYY
jgi:hypothetical protein